MNILYIASQSVSRQQLLREAGISFVVIPQTADERTCPWEGSLQQVVVSIARLKMQHAILPEPTTISEDMIYVLTADTMGSDEQGIIRGKPASLAEAIEYIRAVRNQTLTVTTAYCIARYHRSGASWVAGLQEESVVTARCLFSVPDHWLDRYITCSAALSSSGAVAIEGFGSRFTVAVDGSYTAIMGLPIHELTMHLDALGFFNDAGPIMRD